ncbi:imidazole glycerol phosphate synthase subunit HisF [bacterium]|nr:imidazole glycerol phosphate synthase subunit HisF [bacterium]
MLAKRVIPCLDIDQGRVVKGVNFKHLRDAGDPVALAADYDKQGADELCFLDITATHEARQTTLEVVERVAAQVFIPLTVGGGVRSLEDMKTLLERGADKVSIGSAAVRDPDLIDRAADRFGSQFVVVSIDAKRTGGRHQVYVRGGRERTELDAVEWAIEVARRGAGEVLLNAMDADGTESGYATELTRRMSEAIPVPLIASGGAGSLEHVEKVFTDGKADAALAASIFHFGRYTIGEVKRHLASKGIPVRLV